MKIILTIFSIVTFAVSSYSQKDCQFSTDRIDEFTKDHIIVTKLTKIIMKNFSRKEMLIQVSTGFRLTNDSLSMVVVHGYSECCAEGITQINLIFDDGSIINFNNAFWISDMSEAVMDWNYRTSFFRIPSQAMNSLKNNFATKARVYFFGDVQYFDIAINPKDAQKIQESFNCILSKKNE